MTTREVEWDEEARSTALALEDHTASLCPVCGQPRTVCQDPARQFDWVVDAPVRCHAGTALLARQQAVTEETNPQSHALLWSVHLNEGGG